MSASVTRNTFIVLLLFIGVTLHTAQSAASHSRKTVELCDRSPSELDENTRQRCHSRKLDDYLKCRQDMLDFEISSSFGNDVKLSENEELANRIIMAAKQDEYNVGAPNPFKFNPSRHFFEVLNEIKQSKLFQIIKKMPKGGVLHAHDTALCSTDFLISLTYWPHLWQYSSDNSTHIEKFIFSREQPKSGSVDKEWRLVNDVRHQIGASTYDRKVRSLFTLFDENVNPKVQFNDSNEVWSRFRSIFDYVGPLVKFAPARKAYFINALSEMLDDGVQYLEFRSSLQLYDLDGNIYNAEDVMSMHEEALHEFKNENPTFIGSKCIYALKKLVTNETFSMNFDIVRRLHMRFPQFMAGFDLVGHEDPSPPLISFADQILRLPNDIKFFFHAGETNWFGLVDENLIDAVLLGSHRIGHGYALAKHPKVIDMVKRNDIAIEVNPISNQVLQLVDDIRNHPAAVLFAQNVPVVISSDDPSFWEATPLSHDFYMAFLGIASRRSDLRTLKKFATNSIRYSSLTDSEKVEAFASWQRKWDEFIEDLIR